MASDSYRNAYAKRILRGYQSQVPQPRGAPPSRPRGRGPEQEPITVGIIGAGATGLFAALTLEAIIKEHKIPIQYKILEAESANGEHPVGGRLWTHKFAGGANDYYDRGAMRFPQIPFMKPVFDLFDYVGIQNSLIKYHMSEPNNIQYFNGVALTNDAIEKLAKKGDFDPFKTSVAGLTDTPENLVKARIGPFVNALASNFQDGWNQLMQWDDWSTRDYLIEKAGMAPELVDYLEALSTGTGIWNQSLSETVMDSLDFDYPMIEEGKAGGVDWKCIQGGATVLVEAMISKIPAKNILNGMKVTSIAPEEEDAGIVLTFDGVDKPLTFSHVISTVPFSCFRNIDTSKCDLPWKLKTAIRGLHYDASTKVGIKFKSRWWENLSKSQFKGFDQNGGVSTTDRPTRVVVYPSYGIGTDTGATMIVSYTWAQDALRFGASCRKGRDSEEHLKKVILRDLADMHGITDYNYLPNLVDDIDAWAWYNHENSAGAFALFGPGQFLSLYPQVTQPYHGRLHFAGEATSVHHAWLLGSVDSAARTLVEIAQKEGLETLSEAVKKMWPNIKELDENLIEKQTMLGHY